MHIFVMHKGEDYQACLALKIKTEQENPALHFIIMTGGGENWLKEVREKIKGSDCVLLCAGEHTYQSRNIDQEIGLARKYRKKIFVYFLGDKNCRLNEPLYVKDRYMEVKLHKSDGMNSLRPLFEEIGAEGFRKLAKDGYDFYIDEEIRKTEDPKRMNELISQYQMYLKTSEDVVSRRQTVSSFYIGTNTAVITALSAIVGLISGLGRPEYLLQSDGAVFILMGLLGLILDINWFFQLDSYGKLNSAKMKVISALEKQLPANIYDTEWKVMSEKVGGKRYNSFTNIEKKVPIVFSVLFGLLFAAGAVMLIIGLR